MREEGEGEGEEPFEREGKARVNENDSGNPDWWVA